MWISCSERLPETAGTYPVFAPSADESKPLRSVAWFEPEGTGNMLGWQLLPEMWCAAITHWMQWPGDPSAGGGVM
jgi:hypothetical protein